MAITPGVWGIDLGQCALKALRLEEHDGQIVATAFDYVEHPKILSQPDADPDQLIREALTKFLERNQLRGDIVAISVPGQSGLARFVKLPPVEEKKIGDIVRFEAKQQIPFNLDEVVWDYQKLGSGVVTDGFALETEIGLFAMKRDMVSRYLDHFKEVKVEVQVVQMAPLALCNYVAYDLLGKGGAEDAAGDSKKHCVVALDIGTDSSNLVVTDGVRIIWQRPIPLGGNHFTRALTKDMKLTFAKAEHLKRNATKSPDLKKILAALKPVLNDFVGEVQRSLGFFTNTHRDANIEYMIGLGNAFRLPGLQRFMAEKLQLDLRKLSKLERLGGDTVVNESIFTENILSFAVSYGLALQGLKQAKLLTNLLPPEIRVERLIRAKKPYAVAAAAALLLGASTMLWGNGRIWNAYGNQVVADAKKEGQNVLGRVTGADTAFNNQKAETFKERDAIASIIAGQKERLNWLKLHRFIGQIVPHPDYCVNPQSKDPNAQFGYLVPRPTSPQLIRQWNSEGWQAFEMRNRLSATKATATPGSKPSFTLDDDPTIGLDSLVQFNIIGVDARYTEDLSAFWSNLGATIKDKQQDKVRPATDLDQPPAEKQKGWVVELRGYTFHKGKELFVKDVLMERIAQLGESIPPTPPPGGGSAAATAQPASSPGQPESGQKPAKPRAVSHVVLFDSATNNTTDTSNFTRIQRSILPTLRISPAAASGGTGTGEGAPGTPPGMGGGPTPSSPPGGIGGTPTGGSKGGTTRDGWGGIGNTLARQGNGMGTPGSLGPSGTPPGTTPGTPPVFGPGTGAPGTGFPGTGVPGTGTPSTGQPQSKLTRTEFIILFIWREPTPSDNTLKFPESSGSSGETEQPTEGS